MDDFNKAAKVERTTRDVLLETIAETRNNIAFADAVQRKDWAAAARFQDLGADVTHRNRAALKELAASDAVAVADIMEKADAFGYPPLITYTMSRAAERGNVETVSHIIAKNPPKDVLNHGLCRALLSRQDATADLLLKSFPESELSDTSLFGLLVARPAEYERITAARETPPDYLMHFLNACHFKEKDAIDRSLDRVIAHQDDVRRRLALAGMDFMDSGPSALNEITAHVFESGHMPAIKKFHAAFARELLSDFLLLHVALITCATNAECFDDIADMLKADAASLQSIVLHGASPDRRPAARYLMDKFPDAVKEDSYPVLRLFAASDAPQEFFDAVAAGVPLPKEDRSVARLLAAAIDAKNADIVAHLEAAIGAPSPGVLAELQKNHSTEVMLRAAQLGGDWHANGEALYWRAAAEGRRDILDAMSKDAPLAAAFAYQLEHALDNAVKTNDVALIDDIMARTPWNDELRDKAFEAFMSAPQYLPLLEKLGYAPRPLTENNAHDIMQGKGKESLEWLLAHGFTLDEKSEAAALEIAVKQNERDAIEFLLGRDVSMETAPRMRTMIDLYAAPGTMNVLEKWMYRGDVKPAGDLRARIAAADAAQVIALGVEAAYADVFSNVMQKFAADSFDPTVLSRTKDAYGNSILDILGAHGKLNDILVPELWRDKDAVAFIRDNVHPCYQGQCDFNGLKAALDQQRLKDLGRRARIGLKGP